MRAHQHQWGSWIDYDVMVFEMGLTGKFTYRRECQVAGCNAIEKAEGLQPVGETVVVESPEK